MAMNFKVFASEGIAAKYTADLFRKQMNNNPTSIIATALNDEVGMFLSELQHSLEQYPIDASQIHIFDYDHQKAAYTRAGIVEKQYHECGNDKEIMELIKDEAKTKENKGKLTTLFATMNQDGSVGYSEIKQDEDKGLRAAREIILLITGSDKSAAVEKLYQTEAGNSNFEAANLKTHRMVNVVLDDGAAQGLPADVREYFFNKFS